MRRCKLRGKHVRLCSQHIGDIPLLPKLDRFGFMLHRFIAPNGRKNLSQTARIGVDKFNKPKAVRTGRVVCCNL